MPQNKKRDKHKFLYKNNNNKMYCVYMSQYKKTLFCIKCVFTHRSINQNENIFKKRRNVRQYE